MAKLSIGLRKRTWEDGGSHVAGAINSSNSRNVNITNIHPQQHQQNQHGAVLARPFKEP